MTKEKKKEVLSTESYKGVRDFYPEDQFVQRYMFEAMARVCELYGYEEYNASILESTDLYRGKTSEEIVNEQSYTFTDRGEREVTLRPEMTPTLARMVAARKRDLPLPIRWYSIPNCFRYERPQKGRIREFWQLNADILGIAGIEADVEIIALSHAVMRGLGADERDFEIRVSDRRLLEGIYDTCEIPVAVRNELTQLLDRREKVETFEKDLESLVGGNAGKLVNAIDTTTSSAYLEELRGMLQSLGVRNVVIDTKITRGLQYYTGMVFEIYDTNEENSRALFGGGRYDNLLTAFGEEALPAVGFGMGDVTARDFLQTHNLMPTYAPATELMLCVLDKGAIAHAMRLAQDLRREDVTVSVNLSLKRAGDQIKAADKLRIPFIICIGEKERDSGQYTVKQLETGNESIMSADKIAGHLFSSLG